MTKTESIKIVTPVGMLGYAFNDEELSKAVEEGCEAIIMDSGSTDSGPQKLGLGKMTCPKESYIRDLNSLVSSVYHNSVKLIIGSAGGDGTNAHVDELVEIIQNAATTNNYKLKVLKIYSNIDKAIVIDSFQNGGISSCGSSPELTYENIEDSVTIVGQMGHEPFLEAMQKTPDFDIIIAGRAYDPAPYAAYCLFRGFTDLGIAYNMGKVMECGGQCLVPKSKIAIAEVWNNYFEISTVTPGVKCTEQSLAAHTLYEKTRPDLLPGPGGILDLRKTKFFENERKAGATGTEFIKSDEYTIKLEAAKVCGYRAIFTGIIADPILISNIEGYLASIKKHVESIFTTENFKLNINTYGNGSEFNLPHEQQKGDSVFLFGDVIAETQGQATNIASMARVAAVHAPYPNQLATAGNLAMPIIPLEVPLGEYCEFSIYHTMKVSSALILFPWSVVQISNNKDLPVKLPQTTKRNNDVDPESTKHSTKPFTPATDDTYMEYQLPKNMKKAEEGFKYLYTIAKVVRSKNAGPFEITMDVIFKNKETFEHVKECNALNEDKLSDVYQVQKNDIKALMFYSPCNAFKLTFARKHTSGSYMDNDIHGSQKHVPLMFIQIPDPEAS